MRNLMAIVLAASALVSSGCGNSDPPKVRAYDKVKVGMTVEEAEAALGPAASVERTLEGERRQWRIDGEAPVTVHFRDGKAFEKDATHE